MFHPRVVAQGCFQIPSPSTFWHELPLSDLSGAELFLALVGIDIHLTILEAVPEGYIAIFGHLREFDTDECSVGAGADEVGVFGP